MEKRGPASTLDNHSNLTLASSPLLNSIPVRITECFRFDTREYESNKYCVAQLLVCFMDLLFSIIFTYVKSPKRFLNSSYFEPCAVSGFKNTISVSLLNDLIYTIYVDYLISIYYVNNTTQTLFNIIVFFWI